MSFLRVFKSVLHGLEAGAKIAAPVIAIVNPVVGGLMSQAVNVAITTEATFTEPGTGDAKAKVVSMTTKATIDVINEILQSQGKQPLPATVLEMVMAGTKSVVDSLNVAANTVDEIPTGKTATA